MPNGKKTGKQPYIPLYIGDWERDTNMLSLEAEGGWLKIIFKMFGEKMAARQSTNGLQNEKNGLQGVYKISTKALQNLWRKNVEEVEEIISELKDANICELECYNGIYTFGNRRMIKEGKLSVTRSKAVQNRYKDDTSIVQPSEYEYEYSINNTNNTGNKKSLSMIVPAMIKIWVSKKKDYLPDKEMDSHACLQIAYRIAELEKFSKYEVIDGKEKEVLEEWNKISDFILSDSWFRKLTLDSISTPKMWQKVINAMVAPSSNGKDVPLPVGLQEAREDFYRKRKIWEAEEREAEQRKMEGTE